MVASADLGGLGPKEGTPGFYQWRYPQIAPQLIPWLGLLVLLTLKPNRSAKAWWVWVPLACVAGLAWATPAILEELSGPDAGFVRPVFLAVGVGLAAMWLLAAHLADKHRFLAFLGLVAGGAAFGALAFTSWHDWEDDWLMAIPLLIWLGAWIAVSAAGLSLAGWSCRRQYRPSRILLWLVAWLGAASTGLCAPFLLFAGCSGEEVQMAEVGAGLAFMTLASFLMLLPFLILSFTNDFYCQRLKGLLRLPTGQVSATSARSAPIPEAGSDL